MNSHIDIEKAEKFPIEKVAILGTAFQPVTKLASYVVGGEGQSGLYFVNTAGKTMFKSGNEYIGSLKNVNEMGGDRNDFYYVMEQAVCILCCDEELPKRKLS